MNSEQIDDVHIFYKEVPQDYEEEKVHLHEPVSNVFDL